MSKFRNVQSGGNWFRNRSFTFEVDERTTTEEGVDGYTVTDELSYTGFWQCQAAFKEPFGQGPEKVAGASDAPGIGNDPCPFPIYSLLQPEIFNDGPLYEHNIVFEPSSGITTISGFALYRDTDTIQTDPNGNILGPVASEGNILYSNNSSNLSGAIPGISFTKETLDDEWTKYTIFIPNSIKLGSYYFKGWDYKNIDSWSGGVIT